MTSYFGHINIQNFSEEELRSMVPDPSNGDLTYHYAQAWGEPLPTHQQNGAVEFQDIYTNSSGGSSFGSPQYAYDSSPSPYTNNAVAGSLTASPTRTTGLDIHANGLAGSQAGMGYGMQSDGWEGGQSGNNSSDDEVAGHEWCCNKWHKKGRDLKHNNLVHNHRFPCLFYETCGKVLADNKALIRHYWVHHERYAQENGLPSLGGECEACGQKFSRKDRIPRHLERFPACREKLGL
ncbi:hypothetical protein CEP54_000323 [Fusarium duplospermum]|uniref:C2H2-type domain-containing protein n=1 Tax=Fusarium duplospermum TaxID=1325734 RepID=A0A428R6Q3_9HYPO|nr:hypothetical protein CEP54_000323 [Fusarium duplospermum]